MIRKVVIILLVEGFLVIVAAWGFACRGTVSCIYLFPTYGGISLTCAKGAVRLAVRQRSEASTPPVSVGLGGFEFTDEVHPAGEFNLTVDMRFRALSAPVWALTILFGGYPAFAFVRGPLRRWQRRKRGLCLKCGYDLTGNVSGVCPECGEAI